MDAPETSLRTVNMAKRRGRILDEARRVITKGGIDGLNLRALSTVAPRADS